MAHEILDNMFAARKSAWHNLGVIDESFDNSSTAVKSAGMDYDIVKWPLNAMLPNGETIQFDSYGLLRAPMATDTNQTKYIPLGVCGEDYTFFQNREIAERIDLLSDKTGWKFSTAGVLGKGETIFICLDIGAGEIAGEEVDKFFTYTETRNGKTMARAYISRIRTVCSNTLNLGLRNASSKIALRHYSEYKQDADWLINMMAQAEAAGLNIDSALEELAKINIDSNKFHEMIQAVAPEPSMPNLLLLNNATGRMKEKQERAEYVYNQRVKKVQDMRNAIIANYNSATDIPDRLLGTAWHAYQSVTQYTTHQHGTFGARGRKMSYESRAEYDLLGEGQLVRDAAYQALVPLFAE
jgi:phage/plasmid-like protein (TIGR03299 family)